MTAILMRPVFTAEGVHVFARTHTLLEHQAVANALSALLAHNLVTSSTNNSGLAFFISIKNNFLKADIL